MAATETVTVLFTDMVGATALLERVGPTDADGIRREHLATLRVPVAAHGGREVKNVGDGLMVVFPSSSAAVHCAIEMQQRVAASTDADMPGLRIGIASGDADVEGQDYFGRPVIEASRLCDAASAGQVLMSDLVRMLMGSRAAGELVEVGTLELKGFNEPVLTYEARWSPAEAGAPSALEVPLPAVLAIAAAMPFVGRADEWNALESAWLGASEGRRQVVLVGGDAGAGKTRLVGEFGRMVHRRGGLVLYGSCTDQELPFQPFVEAFSHLLRSVPEEDVAALVGPGVHQLARVLPALRAGQAPDAERLPTNDPDAERYRFFEAVTDLLADVTRHAPLLLILDDLHWADRPTLQLLDHLVRSARLGHLCLVGTYRASAAEMGQELREMLPELVRRPGVARLALGGLDRRAVRSLVEAVAGHEVDVALEPLVAHLEAQTGGNAFLLGELWRHLVDVGCLARRGGRWVIVAPLAGVGSPESVREVVGHRLASLPETTRALLELAAVVGRSFELRLVAAAAALDEVTAFDALEPAIEARLIDDADGARFQFAHALVRQSVEDALAPGARRRHHLAIGESLEVRGDPDNDADLARHFSAAVPLGRPEKAIEYARRAAKRSLDALAYDNAVAVLNGVLPLAMDRAVRADLLLERSYALARAADTTNAIRDCHEAAAIARSLDDHELLVGAALAIKEATWRGAAHGAPAVALLREALAQETAQTDRALLLSGLCTALAFCGLDDEAFAVGEQAIDVARATGDGSLLIEALGAPLFAAWRPTTYAAQIDYAQEGVALAEGAGDDEWLVGMLDKLLMGLILVGDAEQLRKVLDRHGRLARQLRQPLFQLMDAQVQCVLAVHDGRFEDAEAAAEQAAGWAEVLPHAAGGYGVQMFGIRREQGRLEEVRPFVEVVANGSQGVMAWRPGLASLYAELGLFDEARALLDDIVADDLATVPRDSLWAGSLSYLADACVATGHATAASVVYRNLLPYHGLAVTASGLASYGAIDRYLGQLAELLARPTDAARHLESALRFDERTGSPTWTAHSQYAFGAFLARRARRDDQTRAHELLAEAETTAHALGMAALARRCRAARSTMDDTDVDAGDPGLTTRELAILRLVAQGKTNRAVGEELHVSQHTVANHVRAILLKTGCANRAEASVWAQRRGVLGR
jgi:class 3 adenylate cyclase/DNA-binding CsgD family transcriptional regulator/tetratricopeptide (TPR) repeat protein